MVDNPLPSTLDRMRSFLAEFRALRLAEQGMRLRRMEAFLAEFDEWDRQRVDFNLFSLFRIETDEVRHSRFLAWLLDARSGHGQGSLFLQALAGACHLDIPAAALDRYRVRTEFSGEESIVDILACKRGAFVIYLENKILAPEGPDQLGRERRDMRRLGKSLQVPRARQYALFLTPDGRAPVSGDATCWRSISYGRLAQVFGDLLPQIGDSRVRGIVQDWVETVSTFGGAHELVI